MSDEGPTIGELYDRMTEVDRKKAFFLLFGIVEFYGDEGTWLATTILPDHPCGDIVRDYRLAADGKHRPGGRARLALSWVLMKFKSLLT
jgi:hypothetical protein